MVSEYNVKPFGLNVIPNKNHTAENTGKAIEHAIGDLWEPVLEFFKTNEDVFSGNVSQQINKLNVQTMMLGAAVNDGSSEKTLDIKW